MYRQLELPRRTPKWMICVTDGRRFLTPAMAAGLSERLMDMGKIAEVIEATFPKAGRPKTYKTKAA